MATVIAGIAEFERELIQERVRSGLAAAKARGKRLGRQPGHRPESDHFAPKVLALIAQGRSYRLIGRELGLSKITVADIREPQPDPINARLTTPAFLIRAAAVLFCPFYAYALIRSSSRPACSGKPPERRAWRAFC